ncbi:hypothetical protein QQF64_000800 [Cirrhinus molitorella]|uniref:Uncharacterized protein n=1 Tax=Cirrhinus molitorella TaxID=172907 RepID=A0ABR3NYU1_9TELE
MECEIDRRTDAAAAAAMRSMYRTVVVKKAKFVIYWSIYVPTLTHGYELWVMTDRTRARIQTAKISFLRRVAGRTLRDEGKELYPTRGARSRATAPPHREEPVKMTRSSVSIQAAEMSFLCKGGRVHP